MRVDEIMSVPVHSLFAKDPLTLAARTMWEHDCGTVLVVRGDGELAGLVTDRDIAMACYLQGACMSDLLIENAMARTVFACEADDGWEVPLGIMRDVQVRRVPVVDADGRPIGMVSFADFARACMRSGATRQSEDFRWLVGILADISAPRSAPSAAASSGR